MDSTGGVFAYAIDLDRGCAMKLLCRRDADVPLAVKIVRST